MQDRPAVDVKDVDLGAGSGYQQNVQVRVVDNLSTLGVDVQESVFLQEPGIVIGHLKALLIRATRMPPFKRSLVICRRVFVFSREVTHKDGYYTLSQVSLLG